MLLIWLYLWCYWSYENPPPTTTTPPAKWPTSDISWITFVDLCLTWIPKPTHVFHLVLTLDFGFDVSLRYLAKHMYLFYIKYSSLPNCHLRWGSPTCSCAGCQLPNSWQCLMNGASWNFVMQRPYLRSVHHSNHFCLIQLLVLSFLSHSIL